MKKPVAFLSHALLHDTQLAAWFYLLGVTPEQFETVFVKSEYRQIYNQVSEYHRCAAHLRDVLSTLVDDDVHAYIKVPNFPQDNLIYGFLQRQSDGRYLNIAYNESEGISVSNDRKALLGDDVQTPLHPELRGNWRFINKEQRDILFRYGATGDPRENSPSNVVYERVTDNALTDTRIAFLTQIAVRHYLRKEQKNAVKTTLLQFGWEDKEADVLIADAQTANAHADNHSVCCIETNSKMPAKPPENNTPHDKPAQPKQHRVCISISGYAIVEGDTPEEIHDNVLKLNKSDFDWEPVNRDVLDDFVVIETIEPGEN